MDNQLPAEVVESIELKAEHEAALHFHPIHSRDQNTACRICYRNGAKEYAGTVHDRDKKIELLMKSRQNQNEFIDKAIKLLENVLPLLPGTEPIHDKIKSLLDGK